MAILTKERPIWFTSRRTALGKAAIIEVRPRLLRKQTIPGWTGDESSGMSIEELEKKMANKQAKITTSGKIEVEIVDVSQLTDEDFKLRLENIRARQSRGNI